VSGVAVITAALLQLASTGWAAYGIG